MSKAASTKILKAKGEANELVRQPMLSRFFAAAGQTVGYVHMIEHSPGDHCLEIKFDGAKASAFWKSDGWKYSAPVRPEWKEGACDRTTWTSVDATEPAYDGWTAEKNAPNQAVVMTKYGYDTAVQPLLD